VRRIKTGKPAFLLIFIWLLCVPVVFAQDDTDFLIQSAKYLYDSGDFESARKILHEAISKADSNSGRYAACLQNLALIEYMNFNFHGSEELYLRALPITESLSGQDSLATANNLYGLSRCLRRQHRYVEAEPYLSRILSIRARVLGENHRLVTNSLLDLAVNYGNQRKNAESNQYFQRAVQSRENMVGKDSRMLLPVLSLYARQLHHAGDLQAEAVDARINALSSLSLNASDRVASGREEDGSGWQNVAKAVSP
jgi:tetratricopeptide (TPR) repeat protein